MIYTHDSRISSWRKFMTLKFHRLQRSRRLASHEHKTVETKLDGAKVKANKLLSWLTIFIQSELADIPRPHHYLPIKVDSSEMDHFWILWIGNIRNVCTVLRKWSIELIRSVNNGKEFNTNPQYVFSEITVNDLYISTVVKVLVNTCLICFILCSGLTTGWRSNF